MEGSERRLVSGRSKSVYVSVMHFNIKVKRSETFSITHTYRYTHCDTHTLMHPHTHKLLYLRTYLEACTASNRTNTGRESAAHSHNKVLLSTPQ